MASPLYSPSEKYLPTSPTGKFSGRAPQSPKVRLNSPGHSRPEPSQPPYSPSPIQIALEQQKVISELETHVGKLEGELESAKCELANKEDTIQLLKKELVKAEQYVTSHEKLQTTTCKLELCQRENETIKHENQALQFELNAIKKSYAEMLGMNKTLTKKLDTSEKSKALSRTGQTPKEETDDVRILLILVRISRNYALPVQDR